MSTACGLFSPLANGQQVHSVTNTSEDPLRPLDVESALPPVDAEDGTAYRPTQVPTKATFTVGNQLRQTLFRAWLNILLLAVPVGISINFVPSISRIAVFAVNFVAIIPLAALLGFATEEVELRIGPVLGALLNATLG